jgi:hypothetical protein
VIQALEVILALAAQNKEGQRFTMSVFATKVCLGKCIVIMREICILREIEEADLMRDVEMSVLLILESIMVEGMLPGEKLNPIEGILWIRFPSEKEIITIEDQVNCFVWKVVLILGM